MSCTHTYDYPTTVLLNIKEKLKQNCRTFVEKRQEVYNSGRMQSINVFIVQNHPQASFHQIVKIWSYPLDKPEKNLYIINIIQYFE